MKTNQIHIGGIYEAKVNGKLTKVVVNHITKTAKGLTKFHVTNLATARKTVFGSPIKFLREAIPAADPKLPIEADRDKEQKTLFDEQPQVGRIVGREWTCGFCGHVWLEAVRISKHTQNLTGEATVWCPKCNKRAMVGSPKKSLTEAIATPCAMPVPPHIIIIARAGTGKTTTLVEGLRKLKGEATKITPSPQQDAIWTALQASHAAKSVCFVAFNKSIATELQQRVPQGCEAMTMHSLGYRAVRNAFPNLRSPNSYRVQDILSELMERDIRELRKDCPETIQAIEKLVGLCKQNLCDGNERDLADLAAYYEVETNGSWETVARMVPRILERCKRVDLDNTIDFNDMIWLPVVLNLSVTRYDLLLVDEAQDLNRCQQALAVRAGRRLVLCGDDRQAIYGFAGADSESLKRMEETLAQMPQGVTVLPLTVTRRCAKLIVKEANAFVADFEAFEGNREGYVGRAKMEGTILAMCEGMDPPKVSVGQSYRDMAKPGDMVLCRVNAPLVSECFRFLKEGRKAIIQGRDVAQGLISTVKKLKCSDITALAGKLDDWLRSEVRKENAKRNPSEARIIGLQDRYDCLCCFMDGANTVDDVLQKIDNVFTDEKQAEGIRLSSIHRAKGLEADTVFFLEPKGATCPHPMAKSAWAKGQEYNLRYVAITRAISRLFYVA